MQYSIFVPYALQDQPPLNIEALCERISHSLEFIHADVADATTAELLRGVNVSSSKVDSHDELWAAVEPILPASIFDEPRS